MLPGYQLPERTRSICRILKWSTLFIAAILIYFYISVDGADTLTDGIWETLSGETQNAIVVTKRKAWLIWMLASLRWFSGLVLLFGSWHILAAFQTGNAFSLRTVKSIRAMGIIILLEAVFRIIFPTLMIALMTFSSPKGHRLVSVSISTDYLVALLISALFLIIGQIFTQAVRISDENRQIV